MNRIRASINPEPKKKDDKVQNQMNVVQRLERERQAFLEKWNAALYQAVEDTLVANVYITYRKAWELGLYPNNPIVKLEIRNLERTATETTATFGSSPEKYAQMVREGQQVEITSGDVTRFATDSWWNICERIAEWLLEEHEEGDGLLKTSIKGK